MMAVRISDIDFDGYTIGFEGVLIHVWNYHTDYKIRRDWAFEPELEDVEQ